MLSCLAAAPQATEDAGTPAPPGLAVRNLTGAVRDRNEANPRFSPDGKSLSFERREGSSQAIFVVSLAEGAGAPVRVSSAAPLAKRAASAEEALLGQQPVAGDESFNSQISFFPSGSEIVFTGNGTAGTYRIYRGRLDTGRFDAVAGDSKEEGHPAISPDGKWLAYVSARRGIGKLYLREILTGAERALTTGDKIDLYPAWSPDSRSLAFTSGDNDNHDVFLIPDVAPVSPSPNVPAPAIKVVPLTTWKFDDLRPIFSPDGKWIAFYSSYNPGSEDRVWSIVAVPTDGTGPTKGAALAKLTVAVDVVKDPEIGPAWLAGAPAIVYARNLKAEFNPIYTVDIATRVEHRLETGTRMNHDLGCAPDGTLAFRAQVQSWDDIFVAVPPPAAAAAGTQVGSGR
jgi:Tol biopolymer transport system component